MRTIVRQWLRVGVYLLPLRPLAPGLDPLMRKPPLTTRQKNAEPNA
jgi:hypothetical protein